MSLYALADHMASKGRNGDTMLVHMTPGEVAGLHALALAHGGKLTINPDTGLPEANFLKKMLPMIIGMALGPLTAGTSLAFLGATPLASAMTVGGITTLATGSLSRGLMAGLGAYGGASLGAGLFGAESAGAAAAGGAQAGALAENLASQGVVGEAANTLVQDAAKTAISDYASKPFMEQVSGSFGALKDAGGLGSLARPAMFAATPILADQGVQTTTKMPETQGYLRPYVYDPYSQGLTALTPVAHKDAYPPPPGGKSGGLAAALAGGGAVAFADGGSSFVIGGGSENPKPKSDPPVPTQADKDAFYVNRNDTFVQTRVGGSIVPPEFEPEKPVPPDVMKDILEKMANRYDPMTHEKFSDQWKRLGITDPLKSEHLQNIAQGIYNKQLLREKYFGSGSGSGSGGGGGTPNPNQPDPNTPDPNRPDPNTPDPNTPDPNRPDPNTPTPINPIIPAPPPPPPYTKPDPFDPGKVPIDRLPIIEQKKPEDAMSGESLNAYLALMGKGSTATRQWKEGESPGRAYLPASSQSPFFIQRDSKVATPTGVQTTTPITTTNTTNLTNPAIYPSEPAGPGMEWYYDGTKWAKRPMTDVSGTGDTAASGGLMSGYAGGGYALGGLGSLGGYSDGGRLLKGPGDGVSDSIPATIANRRPARLADGEFVIPARIVSELGNGSTDAGARKLYAMMDRVQRARGKTTGKRRVAVNSRADKYLPA